MNIEIYMNQISKPIFGVKFDIFDINKKQIGYVYTTVDIFIYALDCDYVIKYNNDKVSLTQINYKELLYKYNKEVDIYTDKIFSIDSLFNTGYIITDRLKTSLFNYTNYYYMMLNDEYYSSFIITRVDTGINIFTYKNKKLISVINKQNDQLSNFRILADSEEDILPTILICLYTYNNNWYYVGNHDRINQELNKETTDKFLIELYEKEILNK